MPHGFGKVLVANRGEIAVRVMRACREMGLDSVAVYSEADREALHVRYATEACLLGPAPATESYLRVDRILEAARRTGAGAVHPGYGFLAENAELARACREQGVVFIGPSSEAMEAMGSKTQSRRIAEAAGATVVPGAMDSLAGDEEAERLAEDLGYPVMVKAALGGGGKGMRLVERPEDLASALRAARSESLSSFGKEEVYLEKAILRPRHIEVQILGDERGEMVWLGERECSIQRRHQKVIEEAPSPVVDGAMRRRLGETAVSIAREAGYANAGTVEFLLDQDGEFYFLEMNARLQVEHPITEMLTGVDLVKAQIRIALGEPLPFAQEEITLRGHAIEGRVYAEDPDRGFIPSPGRISLLRLPGGPGVRNEVGVYEGGEVPIHYDPLLAKLVVWGADRAEAIGRMSRALGEFQVLGVRTTLPFLRRVMEDEAFQDGRMDTTYIDTLLSREEEEPPSTGQEEAAALAAALEHGLGARGAAVPGTRRGSTWRAQGRLEALRRR